MNNITNNNQQNTQNNVSMVRQLFDGSPLLSGQPGGTSIAELKRIPDNIQQKYQRNLKNKITESDTERDKIQYLVKDINKSLDNYGISKTQTTEDSNNDNNIETDNDKMNDKLNDKMNDKKSYYIPDILKEPLLIIVIYIILSQDFVKKSIGEYISYINPTPDGSVSLIGYLIYGTILASLFVILKKIILVK